MTFDASGTAAVFARYPMVAAYLFGSQVAGATPPRSDVDIAVLLDRRAPSPGDVQVMPISDLMGVLRRNDIDVVILNAATPVLKQRAVARGRLIYCRDDAARAEFEFATLREYLDTQPLRDAQDRALLARYTAD